MSTAVAERLHRLGVAAALTFILVIKQNLLAANFFFTPLLSEPSKNQVNIYLP